MRGPLQQEGKTYLEEMEKWVKPTAFEDYEGSAHLARGKSQSWNVQVVFIFKCANSTGSRLSLWVKVGPVSESSGRQVWPKARRNFLVLEDFKMKWPGMGFQGWWRWRTDWQPEAKLDGNLSTGSLKTTSELRLISLVCTYSFCVLEKAMHPLCQFSHL